MNINWTFVLMPVISGAIGWVTNYIAIKMLFHPQQKINFFLFQLQGVFPKRKHIFAERFGIVVATQLFSMNSIKEKLNTVETRAHIKEAILAELADYLIKFRASNPMLGMFLSDSMLDQVKEKIGEQLEDRIPALTEKFADSLQDIDIQKIVADKVKNFSNDELEKLLMVVISKELRFVEIAGGVLGFMIGLLQVGLLILAK
jgi:uncharacterized membrane protein YheB (UPF0754 family)